MEELIHIPYGACKIKANGMLHDTIIFFNNDINEAMNSFYKNIQNLYESDISYLYFLTTSTPMFPVNKTYSLRQSNETPNHHAISHSCAPWGIFAYSISKNKPMISCRIKNVSSDIEKVLNTLSTLTKNAVSPSSLDGILDDMLF